MVSVAIGEQHLWARYALPEQQGCLWFKGYLHGRDIAALPVEMANLDRSQLQAFLQALDGHYALIFETAPRTLIVVDKVASIPLFYLRLGDQWIISPQATFLVELAGLGAADIDPDVALSIAMAGYSVGARTLYPLLQTLQAGEAALFDADAVPQRLLYYRYAAWRIVTDELSYYLVELADTTLLVLRKMLASLDDRQIVIPLSAGNDSRLIVSGLKHLGAVNVKCFTYGVEGNFEACISQRIAEKLGYEWRFVPLTHNAERRFYASSDFQFYWRNVDSCMAVPYIQGLSAVKYLKESGWIAANAVFVNGNTGDFISGGHIPYVLGNFSADTPRETRMQFLLDEFLHKHFSLWESLKSADNLQNIEAQLRTETVMLDSEGIPDEAMHGVYEYLELRHRQSKYILGNQRIYEFYGYEWRLPLWDDDYLLFWAKVPLAMKAGQHLYKSMLKQQNWGGVWDNSIPINKRTIRPKWLIPLRFLAKCCFAPFGAKGRKAWKRFEMNVFYYWRDLGVTVAMFPFRQVLLERKGPRHVVAFLAERYLAEKRHTNTCHRN